MNQQTEIAKRLHRRSIILMLICSAMWSLAGIFIKMIPWNSFVIAGYRSLIAAVVVAVYMAFTKTRLVLNRSSILSGVMLTLTFFAFVTANKMTTSANAIVLQFTAPIFIILISTVFYQQRFRKTDYAVVFVTLLGISLFFLDQMTPGNMIGNGIGVLSGLFFAAMFVLTGNTDNQSRMSGILLGQIVTALVGIPLSFVFPTPVTSTAVASILVLGVVQLGIPYILYALALEHCPPLVCCLISAVEPLLNPVWVFLFDGERPGLFSLIGGVVVIATITGWNIWNERQNAAADDAAGEA